jgi:hypothetical protein
MIGFFELAIGGPGGIGIEPNRLEGAGTIRHTTARRRPAPPTHYGDDHA